MKRAAPTGQGPAVVQTKSRRLDAWQAHLLRIACWAAFVACLAALTACGGGDPDPQEDQPDEAWAVPSPCNQQPRPSGCA